MRLRRYRLFEAVQTEMNVSSSFILSIATLFTHCKLLPGNHKILPTNSKESRMKKLSLLSAVATAALVAILMSGCAKAPQKDIDAAKAAVESAKAVNAERFAADQLKAAADSLEAAMAEVEAQNAKKLMRSYVKAQALLASAVNAAKVAQDAAVANAAQAKVEAKSMLTKAEVSLAELKKLVKDNAKKIKDKSALKSLEGDVKKFEEGLKAAGTELEGDFVAASDKVKTMVESMTADKEKVTALTAASKKAEKKADKKSGKKADKKAKKK